MSSTTPSSRSVACFGSTCLLHSRYGTHPPEVATCVSTASPKRDGGVMPGWDLCVCWGALRGGIAAGCCGDVLRTALRGWGGLWSCSLTFALAGRRLGTAWFMGFATLVSEGRLEGLLAGRDGGYDWTHSFAHARWWQAGKGGVTVSHPGLPVSRWAGLLSMRCRLCLPCAILEEGASAHPSHFMSRSRLCRSTSDVLTRGTPCCVGVLDM